MQEGRPQRYATQWLDDPKDGRTRPWQLAEPDRVKELRASVGLPPMHPIPEPGPDLPPEQQHAIRSNQLWWEQWLASKGWQSKDINPSGCGDTVAPNPNKPIQA